MDKTIHIIGGGLAGSEAAWQIAMHGHPVILHEMRPKHKTPVHKTDNLAELVCSNSFRSDDAKENAVGLLHEELRRARSLIMQAADNNKVPAGSALAVDREGFAKTVTEAIEQHPLITLVREEVATLSNDDHPNHENDITIIATGPLTSPALAQSIAEKSGSDALAFYDAIAPIIYHDSINFDTAWFQSRYDKRGPGGTGADYINCPMNEGQYEAFIAALLTGEKITPHDWEDKEAQEQQHKGDDNTPYFNGCLPIEVMAERGPETLRYGPMKPVGLTDPNNPDKKPYAVVQLRQDNALGTLYNMVGFQTKLKYGAQAEIFRMIPGLENAEFARLGGLHRNTFIETPKLLDNTLRLRSDPHFRFAGQITGCEGYVESTAIGLLAALFTIADIQGTHISPPPLTSAFGALLHHITDGHLLEMNGKMRTYQPMNMNFGLLPPIEIASPSKQRIKKKERTQIRKQALTARALSDFDQWLATLSKISTKAQQSPE